MKKDDPTLHPAIRAARRRGFFRNLIDWIRDIDYLDPDEVREYMAGRRSSFLDSLTPEQLESLRNYDGPENLGPPLTKRERRDLERRMASPAEVPG